MPTFAHLTRVSKNPKTGPIPVSTSTSTTCPPSCPFREGGCYAEQSKLSMHWKLVSAGKRGTDWQSFCEEIKALPRGQLWRHNQAGDLPGNGEQVDAAALALLTDANRGRRGFTYTHKYQSPEARESIKRANESGFTINLSANNLAQADTLAAYGCGPVAVVLPETQTENTETPEGRRVVICPATKRDNVTCATCGLCQRQRSIIVGFPAHGAKRAMVSSVASNF